MTIPAQAFRALEKTPAGHPQSSTGDAAVNFYFYFSNSMKKSWIQLPFTSVKVNSADFSNDRILMI